jgi:hypothetical protein
MKLGSIEEVEAAAPEIERLVKAWCDWRESG